jgi:hypothetical protein
MSSSRKAHSPGAGAHLDQRLGRVEPVEAQLGDRGIAIRRKSGALDQKLETPRRRAVEADHQQVQVYRQAVHADDLVLARAGQQGQGCGEQFVIIPPRPRAAEMSLHGQALPGLELFAQIMLGVRRLQAERIAAQVDTLVVAVRRDVEAAAEFGQRIARVQCGGVAAHPASSGNSTGREGAASATQQASCSDSA